MSIDQDADSEQPLARGITKYRFHLIAIATLLVIGGVLTILAWRGWDWLGAAQPGSDSNSAILRNIGLVAAGVLSIFLVYWRNVVASRQAQAAEEQAVATSRQAVATAAQAEATLNQANAMRDQTESIQRQTDATLAQVSTAKELAEAEIQVARSQTKSNEAEVESRREAAQEAEQRVREGQLQRGEELLLTEQIAARISGIEVLRRLGLEAPEPYPSRVVHVLCTYIRHMSQAAASNDEVPDDRVQAVVAVADAYQRLLTLDADTNTQLDLTGARLSGAIFGSLNLNRGYLSRVQLARAILDEAIITGAYLVESDLTETYLGGADLTNANLGFSTAYRANFRRAILAGAQLHFAGLAGADFTGADLAGTDLSATRFVPRRDEYRDLIDLLDSETYAQPSEIVAVGLTQQQLDEAVADPEQPPLMAGLVDPETGEPLMWRGDPPPDTSS